MIFFLLLLGAYAKAEKCSFCIENDADLEKQVISMATQSAEELLARVRADKICVKVLDSTRKTPPGTFTWSDLEKPVAMLSEVTQQKALMGKTLCANELPLAKDCITIALASDAPKSTLIHEYLHVKQIQKDASWCAISKSMWGAKTIKVENQKAALDREWDVHRFLWKYKDQMNLAIEDKITITAETLELVAPRKNYDSDAEEYVKKEGMQKYLAQQFFEYQKAVMKK